MTSTIFQLSVDARLLYQRLIDAEVGEILTYSELSEIIGKNLQVNGRNLLQTARKKAQEENNIVFGTIVKVGIKRLDDVEIINSAESDVRRVREITKKVVKRITKVDFSALSNELKVVHNTYLSVFGAIAQSSKENSILRIKNEISKVGNVLPISKTLDIFK